MHLRAAILILYQVKSYVLCRNKLSVIEQSEADSTNSDVSDEINYIEEIHSPEQDRQDISECFQSVDILPLKVHAQPSSGRVN